MPEESELKKIHELLEHQEARRKTRGKILFFACAILAVISVVIFVVHQNRKWEEEMESTTRELRMLNAEKKSQGFADSVRRAENQKTLDSYLKKHPNERPRKE